MARYLTITVPGGIPAMASLALSKAPKGTVRMSTRPDGVAVVVLDLDAIEAAEKNGTIIKYVEVTP